MDSIDREQLEEEVRELSRQCRCRGYDGPCRFCLKAEKLNDKLDKLQAEDEVVRAIVDHIRGKAQVFVNGVLYFRDTGLLDLADSIERGEWKPKTKVSNAQEGKEGSHPGDR
jgi:hypothetical protein